MKRKYTTALLAISCTAWLGLSGCSKCHVKEIKTHAEATWQQAGFDVVGYEGYEYGSFGTWGGRVWYIVRRRPDNGIIYHGFVSKCGAEYHIYNLQAIDALKP